MGVDSDGTGLVPSGDEVAGPIREGRARRVFQWVERCFGHEAMRVDERAARFLEEAIELAQAVGLDATRAADLVQYVYGRERGVPSQEVGGVGVSLLGLCCAIGVNPDTEEETELRRIEGLSPEHFRRRHNAKHAAGVAMRVDCTPTPEAGPQGGE